MLRWERKCIEFFDKWLIEICFIIVTFIAFFLRRQGIWHFSLDYPNNFYTDAVGYLHTVFYSLFIRLMSYIPVTPIRMLKILICFFDFGVALVGTGFIRDIILDKKEKKMTKMEIFFCYSLLLLSPLVLEYGLVWIHIDSISLFLLLSGWWAMRKNKPFLPGICAGIVISLQAQYMILVAGLLIYCLVKKKKIHWCIITAGVWAVLLILSILWSGEGFLHAARGMINWLVLNPDTGLYFAHIGEWLYVMFLYAGYGAGMISLLYAFYRPGRWWVGAGINLTYILLVGQVLQTGNWLFL